MSTPNLEAPLILSPNQVQELSKIEPVVLLDASWFMPNSPRNGKAEFLNKRLPGAQFLDLDEVASTHELGLKHMMPESRIFAEACGKRILNGMKFISFHYFVQEDLASSSPLML